MAYDAFLSEWADSFIERLSAESRTLWNAALDEFLETPVNESTVGYSESGVPDARATEIGLFVFIWRFENPEVIAIANIRWGPASPAGNPDLATRL